MLIERTQPIDDENRQPRITFLGLDAGLGRRSVRHEQHVVCLARELNDVMVGIRHLVSALRDPNISWSPQIENANNEAGSISRAGWTIDVDLRNGLERAPFVNYM